MWTDREEDALGGMGKHKRNMPSGSGEFYKNRSTYGCDSSVDFFRKSYTSVLWGRGDADGNNTERIFRKFGG